MSVTDTGSRGERANGRNTQNRDAGVTDRTSAGPAAQNRNAQPEEGCAPRAGDRDIFLASIDWAAFHEEQRKRDHARKTGDICHKCFKEMPSREGAHGREVYRVHDYGSSTVPVCQDCAPKVLSEEGLYIPSKRVVKVTPAKYRHVWQCSGAECTRTVVFLDQKPPTRTRIFCSEECGLGRKERRPAARRKVCEVCAEPFTAARRDAKHCSAACKQKAYRARRKA